MLSTNHYRCSRTTRSTPIDPPIVVPLSIAKTRCHWTKLRVTGQNFVSLEPFWSLATAIIRPRTPTRGRLRLWTIKYCYGSFQI